MVLLGQTTYNVVLPAARAGRPWTPGAGIVRRRSPGGGSGPARRTTWPGPFCASHIPCRCCRDRGRGRGKDEGSEGEQAEAGKMGWEGACFQVLCSGQYGLFFLVFAFFWQTSASLKFYRLLLLLLLFRLLRLLHRLDILFLIDLKRNLNSYMGGQAVAL